MPHQILDAIIADSRARAAALAPERDALERAAGALPPPPSFVEALRGDTLALIAEVKRRSPSLGAIDEGLDPVRLASAYRAGGACAVSVLTERERFAGSIDDLRRVSAEVDVPTLRKDFLVDPVQLAEARVAGSSAVLLIVRVLSPAQLRTLMGAATALQLDVLVETHSAEEIAQAVDAGARVIGVNARDLDTLRMDCDAAWELLARVPPDVIAVAESGMQGRADVEVAARAGADAVLIGSALVGAGDPQRAAAALQGIRRHGR